MLCTPYTLRPLHSLVHSFKSEVVGLLEPPRRWSAYQTMSHTLTCELAVCQSSWEKYIPDQEEALFQNANMWGMAFFMMCCDDRLSYDDSTLTFKNMILWENAMTQNWPGAFSQTIFIYCSIMCLRSSGQECDRINALAEHHIGHWPPALSAINKPTSTISTEGALRRQPFLTGRMTNPKERSVSWTLL